MIDGKWRENNTEWRDKDGNKRDSCDIGMNGNLIEEPKSLVFFAKAIDLVKIFEDFGYQIFEPNVRCEILRSRVNEAIRASIASHRGRKEFKHLNNGLTMICENFQKKGNPITNIRIKKPGVINGLQTLKSIHDAYHGLDRSARHHFEEDCSVLVRLHMRNAVKDYKSLVKSTNNQNPMQQRNLRANDSEQVTYERLFADIGWFYERKEGAWAAFKSDSKRWGTLQGKRPTDFMSGNISRTVDNERLSQCWLAYIGYSNEAVQKRTDIFRDDELYSVIFLNTLLKHGCEYGYKLDVRKVLDDCDSHSPDPQCLLATYIIREVARKLAPSAKKHRDSAIQRLNLEKKTREEQNEALTKDNEYLKGVILRAISYIFPEMVGFCMYQAFGLKFSSHTNKLLKNGTLKRLYTHADFNLLKTEYESGEWKFDKTDVLQTLWHLFVNIIDNMLGSNWKEQWLIATNRTRFNYRYTTRERFFKDLIEIDKFVAQSQLTRNWAVGINDSKGIFSYLRDHLK